MFCIAANFRRHLLAGFVFIVLAGGTFDTPAQKPRIPPGGHLAVVTDERLAALRSMPDLSARLLRRVGRGRLVSIRGSSRSQGGLLFHQVAINRKTSGWIQSDALVAS